MKPGRARAFPGSIANGYERRVDIIYFLFNENWRFRIVPVENALGGLGRRWLKVEISPTSVFNNCADELGSEYDSRRGFRLLWLEIEPGKGVSSMPGRTETEPEFPRDLANGI